MKDERAAAASERGKAINQATVSADPSTFRSMFEGFVLFG
jgi:hypothetical protein